MVHGVFSSAVEFWKNERFQPTETPDLEGTSRGTTAVVGHARTGK
jgi:hypothetical protein